MPEDIPIIFDDAQDTVTGMAPLVMIGPNGSGKTRHGLKMTGWNQANMIAALRNIALPANLPMQTLDRAGQDLQNQIDQRRSEPWTISNEINVLFSKLMVEHADAAIRFMENFQVANPSVPEVTKINRLTDLWTNLFPGRQIEFTGYNPRVRSVISGAPATYPAQQMSDGERVALYLAARVLDSGQPIIIIDEPEAHFHSRLAARFWNQIEALRSDCRFVYITHDLPFALSRRDATFVLVMPNAAPQFIDLREGVPVRLAEDLLAAASISIHARRIVFCEGTEASRDQELYMAWFRGPDTAVIPLGSSTAVIRSAETFAESKLVSGMQAVGIIDRDYWPERFLDKLPDVVKPLGVHELENLLCLRSVFTAVAKHLGKAESEALYESFIGRAKDQFAGGFLNKQISERFRRRCENEFNTALNALSVNEDIGEMAKSHIEELNPNKWATSPTELLSEERARLEEALASDEVEFLRYFPGKTFIYFAAEALGMGRDSYVQLICSALEAEGEQSLTQLGIELEQCLCNFLPERGLQESG